MRLLCLDYGLQRTGVAVCDAGGSMAFPLCTLRLSDFGSRGAQLDAIASLLEREQARGVVIGLPLLADGSDSETTRQVRNFCRRLKHRTSLPIYYMPEFLSSEEAWDDLRACGLPVRRRRQLLDQQAAVRILQSFLNLPPGQRSLA